MECPRSAKKIVLIAHGFMILMVFYTVESTVSSKRSVTVGAKCACGNTKLRIITTYTEAHGRAEGGRQAGRQENVAGHEGGGPPAG